MLKGVSPGMFTGELETNNPSPPFCRTYMPCGAEGLIDVVRVGVADLRLAVGSHPHLQKVAKRAVAGLSADEGLDAAMVDKVLAREDRRGEGRSGSVSIQRLHHPQTPIA